MQVDDPGDEGGVQHICPVLCQVDRDLSCDGDSLFADSAGPCVHPHASISGGAKRCAEGGVRAIVGFEAERVGTLNDEDDGSSTAFLNHSDELLNVTRATSGGGVGESRTTSLDQGYGLGLDPEGPCGCLQSEIDAALAKGDLSIEAAGGSEGSQASRLQGLGEEWIGQTGIDGDENTRVPDELKVVIGLAARASGGRQPARPAGCQQFGEAS